MRVYYHLWGIIPQVRNTVGEAKSRNFSLIFTVSYSNITHYSTYCTYVHTVPRVTYLQVVKCNNRTVHLRVHVACM